MFDWVVILRPDLFLDKEREASNGINIFWMLHPVALFLMFAFFDSLCRVLSQSVESPGPAD